MKSTLCDMETTFRKLSKENQQVMVRLGHVRKGRARGGARPLVSGGACVSARLARIVRRCGHG